MDYGYDNYHFLKKIDETIPLDVVSGLKNKSFLITGANGFLGKCFSAYLGRDLDTKITLWDNFAVESKEQDCVDIQSKNICEFNLKEESNKYDYIINCAGIASPYWYNKLQLDTINVGVRGLQNILDLSVKGAREKPTKVLYFSSSEIYGTPDICPTPENYIGSIPTMTKRSGYDLSKAIGETLCYIYNNEKNAHAIIVRPFNFCGNFSQNDGRVLPNFIDRVLKNEPVNIYGSGEQTRTFCHIADAISGCLIALVKGEKNQPYNVGNPGGETSMNNLVKTIEKVIGKEVKINHLPAPINYQTEPLRRCPDISKIKELGYEPKLFIEEIIKDFYNWAKENYDYPDKNN